MIIDCPNCDKKFEIDKNLIPPEGRLLQCSSCNNKWFFKTENNIEKPVLKEKIVSAPIIKDIKNLSEELDKHLPGKKHDDLEAANKSKKEFREKIYKKKDTNYFKILVVIIISFVAIILVLDTFKAQISIIIPNIEIILDNLYQSINDIKLFILDLLK